MLPSLNSKRASKQDQSLYLAFCHIYTIFNILL